ncbi:MAG: Mg2+/Co2+ transporter CorB [Candidatus Azotimanducaceae bacterium]|jgi:Mg2+/Co2+ transporter CorB
MVFLSAYFSGSETAMMAMNRFRLRHLSNEGNRSAKIAENLLERPDRLLSVILIGNNLVNFSAASVATLIAIQLYGDAGVVFAPIACTFVFLIFAEVAPKTIAAAYPEKIALPSSYILKFLLWILFPIVWAVNGFANAMLRLIGIRHDQVGDDILSHEELRTVVFEGSRIAAHPQNMMLGILDLAKVSVEDIMVPRTEIYGIDIDDELDDIVNQIRSSQFTRLPVFKDQMHNVIGILHLRNAAKFLTEDDLTKSAILQYTEETYFVPENTPLQTQLINFQQRKERFGLVVDEYGDIQGIVTLDDILEEIVGEFTTDMAASNVDIHPQDDGSFLIDGSAHIRLINRQLDWLLPQDGPKTFNGLIIEYLETIPDSLVCMKIDGYRIEVLQIQDNRIKTARVSTEPEAF